MGPSIAFADLRISRRRQHMRRMFADQSAEVLVCRALLHARLLQRWLLPTQVGDDDRKCECNGEAERDDGWPGPQTLLLPHNAQRLCSAAPASAAGHASARIEVGHHG